MNGDDDLMQHWLEELKSPGWQGFVYVSDVIDERSGDRQKHSGRVAVPPDSSEHSHNGRLLPLAAVQVGDRVRLVSLNCGDSNNRLMGMGLMPGVIVEAISRTATGSVIIALQNQRLGLGADMAHRIQVIQANQPLAIPANSSIRSATMHTTAERLTIKLRDAAIGSTLRVMGYEPTARDYKRKLLAMGLTPGTELRVTRHAPLGDPTEVEVRGFHLSLRQAEADALIAELVTGGMK